MAKASKGEGCVIRRPRGTGLLGLLGRMLTMCAALWHGTNSSASSIESQPQNNDDITMVLSSCDDLRDERTIVHGIVALEGDIICQEKRVRITCVFGCGLYVPHVG